MIAVIESEPGLRPADSQRLQVVIETLYSLDMEETKIVVHGLKDLQAPFGIHSEIPGDSARPLDNCQRVCSLGGYPQSN